MVNETAVQNGSKALDTFGSGGSLPFKDRAAARSFVM